MRCDRRRRWWWHRRSAAQPGPWWSRANADERIHTIGWQRLMHCLHEMAGRVMVF